MNVTALFPLPIRSEAFRMSRVRFVPETSGCYVLATFDGVVLYIGLTTNLRRRISEHLDNREKTRATPHGRAILVYWVETLDTNRIERTWLNIHIECEGSLPVLNAVYSPVST